MIRPALKEIDVWMNHLIWCLSHVSSLQVTNAWQDFEVEKAVRYVTSDNTVTLLTAVAAEYVTVPSCSSVSPICYK